MHDNMDDDESRTRSLKRQELTFRVTIFWLRLNCCDNNHASKTNHTEGKRATAKRTSCQLSDFFSLSYVQPAAQVEVIVQ